MCVVIIIIVFISTRDATPKVSPTSCAIAVISAGTGTVVKGARPAHTRPEREAEGTSGAGGEGRKQCTDHNSQTEPAQPPGPRPQGVGSGKQ